jgi:hypothetical protein
LLFQLLLVRVSDRQMSLCYRAQDDRFIHYQSVNVSNNQSSNFLAPPPPCDPQIFLSPPAIGQCFLLRDVACSLIPPPLFLRLVLGYAYPAYDCYKTVELNRPDVEQLRFWCQYWFVSCAPSLLLWARIYNVLIFHDLGRILLAVLTAMERVGDDFASW